MSGWGWLGGLELDNERALGPGTPATRGGRVVFATPRLGRRRRLCRLALEQVERAGALRWGRCRSRRRRRQHGRRLRHRCRRRHGDRIALEIFILFGLLRTCWDIRCHRVCGLRTALARGGRAAALVVLIVRPGGVRSFESNTILPFRFSHGLWGSWPRLVQNTRDGRRDCLCRRHVRVRHGCLSRLLPSRPSLPPRAPSGLLRATPLPFVRLLSIRTNVPQQRVFFRGLSASCVGVYSKRCRAVGVALTGSPLSVYALACNAWPSSLSSFPLNSTVSLWQTQCQAAAVIFLKKLLFVFVLCHDSRLTRKLPRRLSSRSSLPWRVATRSCS